MLDTLVAAVLWSWEVVCPPMCQKVTFRCENPRGNRTAWPQEHWCLYFPDSSVSLFVTVATPSSPGTAIMVLLQDSGKAALGARDLRASSILKNFIIFIVYELRTPNSLYDPASFLWLIWRCDRGQGKIQSSDSDSSSLHSCSVLGQVDGTGRWVGGSGSWLGFIFQTWGHGWCHLRLCPLF